MARQVHFLAIDLGASTGRVVDAALDGRQIALREVHRFPNRIVHVPDSGTTGRLCWDLLGLWDQIKVGLRKAATETNGGIASIGVDAWGVDYGLIGESGRLVALPAAYRDARNLAACERVQNALGRDALYAATGIQVLPFNTLYQLAADAADKDKPLERAKYMLLIPDLMHFWLTQRCASEHTNASTTQMYDARTRQWIGALCEQLDIPARILPPILDTGTPVGTLSAAVADEVGLSPATVVTAPATHDTASAVAGTPLADRTREAYLSSGTWSLLGLELLQDCRSPGAQRENFTNEAGAGGTTRFLKNVAGLWLVQECQRCWAEAGRSLSSAALAAQAGRAAPFRSLINPDDPRFAAPGDMPARIRQACRELGEPEPADDAALIRCILDSLALRYDQVLRAAIAITGQAVDAIRVVGGGSRNKLLNRLTAAATDLPVIAGPAEATAFGNAAVQAIAAGELDGLSAARRMIADSVKLQTYEPPTGAGERAQWSQARQRFVELTGPAGMTR